MDAAEKEKKADASPPSSDAGSIRGGTSGFTLETLQAEVDTDPAAGGHNTAYDRTRHL